MISFNFYGFTVCLKSNSQDLINLLEKNFSYFVSAGNTSSVFSITANLGAYENLIPSNIVSNKQSINSITYDIGHIRYNDYYGSALSVMDYNSNHADVYSDDINRLHEITYLLIMSRQGKWCDINGIHKIHAMGVSNGIKNLLLMLPMKGGKSTTFAKFLEHSSCNLISDDSPCINKNGQVLNFPIRFGLESKTQYESLINSIDEEYIFQLHREQFGTKTLIDMKYFSDRIKTPADKTILVQGVRVNGNRSEIISINKLKMFKNLFVNMTIGVGLPMIIEYFIENTILDHFKNFKIFLKRLYATINLLKRSETYYFYMGNDIDKNYKNLSKLITN